MASINPAQLALSRLLPHVERELDRSIRVAPEQWRAFRSRAETHWDHLFSLLTSIYPDRYDLYYHLEQLLLSMGQSWSDRPEPLRQLDTRRESDPAWFQSHSMLGAILYVDLFASNLAGLRQHIGYLHELGVTYLHVMPLFESPPGNSDGGYAVSSYRHVHPALGTMAQLAELAAELRHNGISLVLDLVFNHTSDEHEWARRAETGEPEFLDHYYVFPDRSLPDAYEAHLREIFPSTRRGSFTWNPRIQAWVWTTFNSFQWELNYSNPAVFVAMAREMLFLANAGAEVLRLDAVAFIWKQLGTSCENLPQAHQIIQAMNAVARIAAPSLLFKSEAIVHPDEVERYISPSECQISYNPLLMALLWEALATREVRLLAHSMRRRFAIPAGCAWVNYLRCHDDIGWTFDDADARSCGIDPVGHRQFLNAFYTGRFPGSFARGVPFQENPETGDARVSGTLASLAGLESALHTADPNQVQEAINRILMLHSIIMSIGGIPLIYLGDETGILNDYSYASDPAKAADSRWVHRIARNWDDHATKGLADDASRSIRQGIESLIKLRKSLPVLRNADMLVIECANPHVFAYARYHANERLIAVTNFSEHPQQIDPNPIRTHGLAYTFTDLIADQPVSAEDLLELQPYQYLWLVPA